jgi:hypothetical protein
MAKRPDFLNEKALKNFFWRKLKMRSRADTIAEMKKRFNQVIADVATKGAESAKEADLKTVLPRHVADAFDLAVGKSDLAWEEILAEIMKETPADLGKITRGVEQYLQTEGPESTRARRTRSR